MQFSEPWEQVVDPKHRAIFEAELQSEVNDYHAALFVNAGLLARRLDRDDFLFETENAQWPYAIVHLTFSGRAETHPWPITQRFENAQVLMVKLAEDAADYSS